MACRVNGVVFLSNQTSGSGRRIPCRSEEPTQSANLAPTYGDSSGVRLQSLELRPFLWKTVVVKGICQSSCLAILIPPDLASARIMILADRESDHAQQAADSPLSAYYQGGQGSCLRRVPARLLP